jgi:hypothetical protein
MISPSGMAIAALTVMLWILWSDSFRRSPHPIVYVIRIGLFLIVAGVMTVNLFRMPHVFTTGSRVVTILTVIVAVGGVAYFVRKLSKR